MSASTHCTDRHRHGFFDSRARLNPPLRQQRDRDALRVGLADAPSMRWYQTTRPWMTMPRCCPLPERARCHRAGTAAEPGLQVASGQRCAFDACTVRGDRQSGATAWQGFGSRQGRTGHLAVGGLGDVCVFDPQARWTVRAMRWSARASTHRFQVMSCLAVRCTMVGGHVVFRAVQQRKARVMTGLWLLEAGHRWLAAGLQLY